MNLIHGDCLEVMPTMEAESVDAVVTDPPYGLGFMGKHWDHGVPAIEFWQAMYRVAKPGAYLLSFGGTRTVHRIATNIEDAGWIIRDQLSWIYASGFPKGKANLKPAHEPIVLARKPGPLRPLGIDECRIGTNPGYRYNADRNGTTFHGEQGERLVQTAEKRGADVIESSAGRWPSNVLLGDAQLFDQPNPYVVGSGARPHNQAPETRQSRSKVAGVTELGTGESIEYEPTDAGYSRFFIIPKADRAERERGLTGSESLTVQTIALGEFEYATYPDGTKREAKPKARANVHPTVKPIDLMRHLVRLVTPQGGTVLDPFLGSGTTAIACEMEGFQWIGIERESEYVDIARARITASPRGLGL